MTTPVRFDDSLRIATETLKRELGPEALARGVLLRDASGRLSFFADHALPEETASRTASALRVSLGAYGRPDRVLAVPPEEGTSAVLKDPSILRFRLAGTTIRLIDRRLAGADWMRPPAQVAPGPPRFVFASLKGGVGRSTALSIVAAHLAERGGRVLAIDVDIEAPGLGTLLLDYETTPEFGTLDYLVEGKIGQLDENFWVDLIGPSSLATKTGRIDVVPAYGRSSLTNPADVLSKISRGYLEHVNPDGTVATVLDQIRLLVDHVAQPERYDAVLVDARAGLHETTAASILGLGADIFLFGVDEPQTFQGYAALLAHLARFVPPEGPLPEWVDRLTAVHAKAPVDAERRMAFDQQWQYVFGRYGPSLRPPVDRPSGVLLPEGFRDVAWDESVSDAEALPAEVSALQPIAVLRDDRYERFDPMRRRDLLSTEVYTTTFGDLLRYVDRAVSASAGAGL